MGTVVAVVVHKKQHHNPGCYNLQLAVYYDKSDNRISGTSGSNIEDVVVNGTTASKMFVTYHPVKAFQNTWAVLLIQKAR